MVQQRLDDAGPSDPTQVSAASIARELGVSAATVSYALNGKPGVSDQMRRRILKLANARGLRPSATGSAASALTRVIALIVPNLTNPMFPYWSHEILEVAASEGFEVLVVATDDDPARLEAAARTLVNRNIDGAIVLASHREDATALLTLREERIPFTFLSRRSEYVSADFVGIDDYTASRQVAEHVVSHQPQRPATVVGPRFSTASAQREKGMNDALSNARLHVPTERRIATDLSRAGGHRAARHLMALPERPDAILCGSDEISLGVMEALAEDGIEAGRDMIVTGFDGLRHTTSPLIGLTTVIQPLKEMGSAAAHQLLHRLRSGTHDEHRTVIVPHTLHIGRTCGCPRTTTHFTRKDT